MSSDQAVVDLSLQISQHFRWSLDMQRTQAFEHGDVFQTSRISMACHAFTHVDAPLHFVPGGMDIASLALSKTVGPAAVLDLRDVGAEQPVTRALLRDRGAHVRAGDRVLLATRWDEKADVASREYWTTAPYVQTEAAEWLLEREPSCVGFDFPQDHCIRRMGGEAEPRREEFVTHDVLLSQGVLLVEYLAGLGQLTSERVWFAAAPLRLDGADGSPVRALAVDRPSW